MEKRYLQLSLQERDTIADMRAEGKSIRKIAATLDRAPSSIAREVKRNVAALGRYRAHYAQEQTWARRWRGSRLERMPELQREVLGALSIGFSPEQVAGRMALDNARIRVSHETIYRFIYAQIKRTGDYKWRHYLVQAKAKRGYSRRSHRPMEHIKDRVSISQRPSYIDKRRQFGHWEVDLLHPRKSGAAILVAEERASRYTFLSKQPGKHAQPVVDQLKGWLEPLPAPLRRSVTQDNGPEFFLHYQLNPLNIKTYFCDPHSPWQKGGIENMNGRLRRFIPLGTDPDSFTNQDLQLIADIANNTPRKCLGFRTPAEVLLKQLSHLNCESTSPPSRG